MKVVSNASPLIGLSMINHFDLLKKLFNKVYIPEAVYNEMILNGKDKPGSRETEKAIVDTWLEKVTVKDRLAVLGMLSSLDEGEAEAIVLTKELNADYVLLDEEKGREMANSVGLNIIGTIGILSLAKKRGFSIELQADLDELKSNDFRISKKLYEEVIRESEKLPKI